MSRSTNHAKIFLCILAVINLTGCTTSFAIRRANNLPWGTPSLNKTECPKLNGVYENAATLEKSVLTKLIANFQTQYKDGTVTPIVYKPEVSANTLSRKDLIMEIKHLSPFVIETRMSDRHGENFTGRIYRFEKEAERFVSGCFRNSLVIRKLDFGGNEWYPAAITEATETHFRKLPNGDLEVSINTRSLNLKNDIPRIENTVEIFKLYKPSAP